MANVAAMKGMLHRDEASGAMIARGAIVTGDVRLGRDANIWFACVLRGDDEPITIGEASNVQDGTIVHVDMGFPTVVGSHVTIGHKAMVHGCRVEDHALIGMCSTILTGATIGEYAIVAAGALVPEGMQVPPRTLVMGMPARVRRDVTPEEIERAKWRATHYVETARRYL